MVAHQVLEGLHHLEGHQHSEARQHLEVRLYLEAAQVLGQALGILEVQVAQPLVEEQYLGQVSLMVAFLAPDLQMYQHLEV